MNTQQTHEQEYDAAYPCPTSPWTECFQDAPGQQAERAAFGRSYDRDDQRPTHDALSDIYNREDK